MRSSLVADAMIFSTRELVQKTAGDYLKIKGVSNVMIHDDAEACLDGLGRFPKALLIVDWQSGAEIACRLLAENRKKPPMNQRSVLLIADSMDEALVATAAEYNVAQVYTEPVNSKGLGARLTNLMIADSMPSEVRKGINDAAELRIGGDIKGCLAILQKLLAKNATTPRLRVEAADCLMTLDDWETALKLLDGLDQGKPPYIRAIHLQGRCLMKLGRFDEAMAAFEKANLFNPNDSDRLVDLGNCLLKQDRVAEADDMFQRALAIDPSSRDAKLGKGSCALADMQVNEALSILREVTSEQEIAAMFNATAVMSMRRGQHEKGMSLYQAAVKALGRDEKVQARLFFNMGIGYRRWGKRDKALACFEESQRLDPGYGKAREQLLSLASTSEGDSLPAAKAGQRPAADLPSAGGGSSSAGSGGLVDLGNSDLAAPFEDDDLEEGLYD